LAVYTIQAIFQTNDCIIPQAVNITEPAALWFQVVVLFVCRCHCLDLMLPSMPWVQTVMLKIQDNLM